MCFVVSLHVPASIDWLADRPGVDATELLLANNANKRNYSWQHRSVYEGTAFNRVFDLALVFCLFASLVKVLIIESDKVGVVRCEININVHKCTHIFIFFVI